MTASELEALRAELSPLPAHIGIIMDGNGRWAAERGLPRALGHRAGTERLRGIIRLSSDLGIKALSLYAFSTENWRRPRSEVDALFALFMEFFVSEVDELNRNGVRIAAMGDTARLPGNVRIACLNAMKLTENNAGLKLNVALNYGSRAEIAHAARELAAEAASNSIAAGDIDEAMLDAHMWVKDVPAVDLIIRTGGEKRLSNFMLLQSAYAELEFVDDYWPDFSDARYIEALRDYAGRNRRFGGLGDTANVT